jgi:hypothetical protein
MSTVIPPAHAVADPLIGRAEELALIGSFLDDVSVRGAALLRPVRRGWASPRCWRPPTRRPPRAA